MAELLNRAEPVHFQPGETLIAHGDFGDGALFIISGRATQYDYHSTMQSYTQLGPGSLVNEMAMLIETQQFQTVVADEPIKAAKFRRDMIQSMMLAIPEMADFFVQRIAARLGDLAQEMREYEQSRSEGNAASVGGRFADSNRSGDPVSHDNTLPAFPTLPLH